MKKNYLLSILFGLSLCLQLPSASAARSLVVTVYLHDDLSDIADAQLHHDYFQHWLDEMHTFTKHPVELIFRRNVPGITDIAYHGLPSTEILQAFTREIGDLDLESDLLVHGQALADDARQLRSQRPELQGRSGLHERNHCNSLDSHLLGPCSRNRPYALSHS